MKGICNCCKKELTNNEGFVYCPYCGEKIEDDMYHKIESIDELKEGSVILYTDEQHVICSIYFIHSVNVKCKTILVSPLFHPTNVLTMPLDKPSVTIYNIYKNN